MATHAYIFHTDGRVSQRSFGANANMSFAVDAVRKLMPTCQYVEMDVSDRTDGRQWVLIMDEEGMFRQSPNGGLGGFLMNLERLWYGDVMLVQCSDSDPEQLCPLDPLPCKPGDIVGLYMHLALFRNDWRRAHGLPPAN